MRIKSLTVYDNTNMILNVTFEDKTLIYSQDNSKGKTSLIRFILYGLGFKIASTQNLPMKDFVVEEVVDNYENREIKISRKNSEIDIMDDGQHFRYKANQQREVFGHIFGPVNSVLCKNILGAFYIDQDVGWSMTNFGSVTKSYNIFDINDFVNSIENIAKVDNINERIKELDNSIRRYESLLTLSEYKQEISISKEIVPDDEREKNNRKKIELLTKLERLKKQLDYYDSALKENDLFIKQLTSMQIFVKHGDNEPFVLCEKDVNGFTPNQIMIKTKKYNVLLEIEDTKKELESVEKELEKTNELFKVEELSSQIISRIQSYDYITQSKLIDIINKLKEEKKNLKKDKQIQKSDNSLVFISNKIIEMSKELGVFDDYIKKTGGPISKKENSLWSGAILNKIVVCYRCAYLAYITNKLNINLPIIIDSPGANEMTETNVNLIIRKVFELLDNNQIIVSSIYPSLIKENLFSKQIIIRDKLFSKNNY